MWSILRVWGDAPTRRWRPGGRWTSGLLTYAENQPQPNVALRIRSNHWRKWTCSHFQFWRNSCFLLPSTSVTAFVFHIFFLWNSRIFEKRNSYLEGLRHPPKWRRCKKFIYSIVFVNIKHLEDSRRTFIFYRQYNYFWHWFFTKTITRKHSFAVRIGSKSRTKDQYLSGGQGPVKRRAH